ncbi:MAG: alpha/beta fold hydrolase [Myxococcota bacterium]
MQFDLPLPPLTLQCGLRLPGLHVRGWAAGPGLEGLSPIDIDPGPIRRDAAALETLWASPPPRLEADVPTVLFMHALTGDAQAGEPDGWWSFLIGPDGPYDPTKTRLIGLNHLGSCYGSYGPADAAFPRWSDLPEPPDLNNLPPNPSWRPAPLTAWDQARVTLLALDGLGVKRVERVVGGSIGGNLALCMQVLAPDRFEAVDAVACGPRSTPWILGFNHVGRQAVLTDPVAGLPLARALAHLSYRSEQGLEERQGRTVRGTHPFGAYAMQTYLQHHGAKLVSRFDPASYVSMLDAMDHHDLETRPTRDDHESWSTDGEWGRARLHDVRGVGIHSDELFHPHLLRALCESVPGGSYRELSSPHGHDAFLMPGTLLGTLLEIDS